MGSEGGLTVSILNTLITDRTEASFYGAPDLNRVGEAMQYVAARLRSCGWDVTVSPRTDWTYTDRATQAEAQRYLRNLRKLRETLVLYATTPPVPGDARPFNAEECNDIERILLDIEAMVQLTIDGEIYTDEVFCGEV